MDRHRSSFNTKVPHSRSIGGNRDSPLPRPIFTRSRDRRAVKGGGEDVRAGGEVRLGGDRIPVGPTEGHAGLSGHGPDLVEGSVEIAGHPPAGAHHVRGTVGGRGSIPGAHGPDRSFLRASKRPHPPETAKMRESISRAGEYHGMEAVPSLQSGGMAFARRRLIAPGNPRLWVRFGSAGIDEGVRHRGELVRSGSFEKRADGTIGFVWENGRRDNWLCLGAGQLGRIFPHKQRFQNDLPPMLYQDCPVQSPMRSRS